MSMIIMYHHYHLFHSLVHMNFHTKQDLSRNIKLPKYLMLIQKRYRLLLFPIIQVSDLQYHLDLLEKIVLLSSHEDMHSDMRLDHPKHDRVYCHRDQSYQNYDHFLVHCVLQRTNEGSFLSSHYFRDKVFLSYIMDLVLMG